MDLSNKTFLITGASKGIGYALAQALDKEGAHLILTARNAQNILIDPRHTKIDADLTDDADIDRLLQALKGTHIDALLNVAGIGIYKPLEELTKEDLDVSIKLNVITPFVLIKNLLPNLNQSELSLVLNIGSGAGVMPFINRSAYCVSKFGLRGLTLTLAKEFENRKPHFCLITLGSTMTTFGGKTIEDQIEAAKKGKESYSVEWVTEKLIEIIKDKNRETEITLFPKGYIN